MRKRKINQELLGLLTSGRLSDFTVSELKSAYMMLPSCEHHTEKAAWQFVYRTVLHMEKTGLLRRLTAQEGDKTRYQLIGRRGAPVSTPAAHQLPSGDSIESANEETIRCLKEKLHRYKVEMLSAIGETEEYDSICVELPHMQSTVQTLYNEARDRCSKTLGRVRALESILSNHPNLQPS